MGIEFERVRKVKSRRDRKSTRLNSSHDQISYAVFCLKKKNTLNKKAQEEYFLFFECSYDLTVTACRFFTVYTSYQSLRNPYTGAASNFIRQSKNSAHP